MEKKRIVMIVVAVVIAAGIGIFAKVQLDQAAKKEQMEKMAQVYYEDYLYDMLTSGMDEATAQEYLSQYHEEGLRTSIENIEKVVEIDVEAALKKLGDSCDQTKESVTIYPEDPYGKTNYKVKVVCE